MLNQYIKKYSPFSYNTPTNYETYTGRKNIIQDIEKNIKKIENKNPQHYILTGKKGYGKTSTCIYLEEKHYKLHTVYVNNENNDSLENLTTEIIETLLNLFPQKIKEALKNNMFQKATNDLEPYSTDIKKYFPSYLEYTCKYLKKPILLIIDNIDPLLKQKQFTNWYESINDTIKNNTYQIPIYFLLTSKPETYKKTPPKFKKIFQTQKLEKLKDEEVEEFFINAFETVEMEIDTGKWDENPYKSFINFTSGIPWLMQTIGEKIFQHAHHKNKITQHDIDQGLIDSAEITYTREIKPIYEKHFKDPVFDKIYKKTIKTLASDNFTIKDFKETLKKDELIFLEEYLQKAIKLEIIKKEKENYSFTNHLYSVYFTEKIKQDKTPF